MKENDLRQRVFQVASAFRQAPNLEDKEIYQALLAEGVERQLAAGLVEFLPIAYCRLILADSGLRFSTTFRRVLSDGTIREQPFSSEPVWNAAVAFARAEVERGATPKDLLAVAGRSAEFDAANQLLHSGSKLKDIALTVPLLTWPEIGPDPA
jgi:hypothetical protein